MASKWRGNCSDNKDLSRASLAATGPLVIVYLSINPLNQLHIIHPFLPPKETTYQLQLMTTKQMIIGDIRREFFDVIKGRILVMCALDVDAICACKILQFLLESYNLQYSVAPVASTESLLKSFEEYRNSVDSIVMINFGNLFNILKLLRPAENLNFYVIDSHRPINIYNYYKNPQVKVLINKHEPDLNIPSRRKLFLKDDQGSNEEESEAAELALLMADARSLTNEQLEKRRELRDWIQEKQRLLFDYEENNFYNRAVSLMMYDLANYLSKNNNYLLWLSIVGLTYQLRSEKISDELFEQEAERIVRYIARNQVSSNYARGNRWRIEWQKDVQMELYRKWNIYESLSNTPLTVCAFQLWNDHGQRDLHEFLVNCGLKLEQCKQNFPAMVLDFKKDLLNSVQNVCLGDLQYKYNLQRLISRTFVMSSGFNHIFCANDFVLAIRALLESHDPGTKMTEKFVRAIQSVSYDEFTLLEKGFEAARTQMKSMFQQVKALITTMKVNDAGMFLHVDLQDQQTISRDFARGDSLMAFARFLLNAYCFSRTTRVARRAVRLPLILFSPDYYNEDEILIVGIPPIAQESKKNFFGKAFEQAAANIECEIRPDLSETNLIRTNVSNKNPIFEQLKLLLE